MSEFSPETRTERGDSTSKISMSVKITYTAFMAVLVPWYHHAYGAANFLWFCDVALMVTLVGLWTESKFLISTQAVAIVFPQLLWVADFFFNMSFGKPFVGLATYMFDPNLSLFVRGLSLFHGWMPFLLLWLVWRLGYDRNAWKAQIVICWIVLLTAFLVLPGPDSAAGNVNKVFGWGETTQTVMHPVAWLGIVMLAYPLLAYLPSHLVFTRLFSDNGTVRAVSVA
ncbi:MAG: hypothetical protein O3B13_00140 [Planctomycetota bacterium]|nr:hypothetical protein [Planctomycetota bacterium]MDA1161489.1 hypothetical protein [Planctomycetota bacterium]